MKVEAMVYVLIEKEIATFILTYVLVFHVPNLIVPHAIMGMAERGSKSKYVVCYSQVVSFILQPMFLISSCLT